MLYVRTAGGAADIDGLLQRRAAYMQGLVDSLRLTPQAPLDGAAAETGDGVLLRLLELRKGRGLLARILNMLMPPSVRVRASSQPQSFAVTYGRNAQTPGSQRLHADMTQAAAANAACPQ